jgi:hypothetical protein
MDTNPQSEVSVEDRLSSILGQVDEEPDESQEPDEQAEESEQVEQTEQDEADEATPDEETVEEAPESEEIEFEGKAYKVPKELKDAFLRQADYTRKTQEVAETRKTVEDRAQFLEAKEALLNHAYQEATELRAIQMQLEQFDALDWSRLAEADMQQAYKLDLQRQELRKQLQTKEQAINAKVQQIQQAVELHKQKQLELGRAELQRRVGTLRPEDAQATWRQGLSLGFTESELASIADARIMHALYLAAKYQSVQGGKTIATKKAESAKPMKPVSRSAPQAQRDSKVTQSRESLKKTGRLEDAVDVLARRFSR